MSLDERFVMSDWMKPRDLLIEETLAFSQRVTADTKVVKPAAVVPKTYEQKPVTATLTEKPDMERAAIQRRVMNFNESAKSIMRRPWQRPAPPNGTRRAIKTADGADRACRLFLARDDVRRPNATTGQRGSPRSRPLPWRPAIPLVPIQDVH